MREILKNIPKSAIYHEEPGIVLLHGDCLELLPLLPEGCVDMVLTDPPYNIGKATWDSMRNYYPFIIERFKACEARLNDRGTFWYFHMNFSVMADIHQSMKQETGLRHKQLIILDKGIKSIVGRAADSLRSFPRATEYLQFYTFDDPTGAEQLSDQYARVNPMARYLKEEFERAGYPDIYNNLQIKKEIAKETSVTVAAVEWWLLGARMPLKGRYEKMRDYLNGKNNGDYLRREYEDLRREYEDLRREYEDLRREYEDLRYRFNLPPFGVTDVWYIDDIERNGHETPKPLSAVTRAMAAGSNTGDLILDPFLGSGTTAVAAKQLGRKCIGIELEAKYLDIAINRLRQGVLFAATQEAPTP